MRKFLFALVFAACPTPVPTPPPAPPAPVPTGSTLTVSNHSGVDTTVYVAFGADSAITSASWPFCTPNGNLNCSFSLPKQQSTDMPLGGQYVNATFSFFQAVTCNTTKAEVNLNNPNWYDIADISLVDGFNVPVKMEFAGQTLQVTSITGNEQALGVYPNGCDICVARQQPPCGMTPGSDGCKSGTQYDPDVPCQVQGVVMGGGNNDVVVELFGVEPA